MFCREWVPSPGGSDPSPRKIKDTISEGEFGKRGEEYVAAQAVGEGWEGLFEKHQRMAEMVEQLLCTPKSMAPMGQLELQQTSLQVFLILCVLVGTVPLLGGSLYFLAGPLCMAAGGAIVAAALSPSCNVRAGQP